MIYVRAITCQEVWSHAQIDWKKGLARGLPTTPTKWRLATYVVDGQVTKENSKFFKSIEQEVNDAGKKASLLEMLHQLSYAITQEDYQGFLKNASVSVKCAHDFKYAGSKHKVWELKYQNKDRLYFFSHRLVDGPVVVNVLVFLLFRHKNTQTTPEDVKAYCEKIMKLFLEPRVGVKII
jgi:hypothetical protein